ncbi:myosin-2 heavy chain-like, partial [Paramacrobiotus metropolitanus]|uniref:myosin-2 heavy chain-like n=1 Tax=Paramacrobiotus metropolitanus TaxID=2943436 RepID=UPI002445F7E8
MNQKKVTGEEKPTERGAEPVGASQLDATTSRTNEQDKNVNLAQVEAQVEDGNTKVTEEDLAELGLDDLSLNDKTVGDDLWATPMVSDESNESYFTDDEATMNMSFQTAMKEADRAEGMTPFKDIPEYLIERTQTGKVSNVRPPSPNSPTTTLRTRVRELESELEAKESQAMKRTKENRDKLSSLEARIYELEQQQVDLESAADEWKIKYERQRELAEEYLKMADDREMEGHLAVGDLNESMSEETAERSRHLAELKDECDSMKLKVTEAETKRDEYATKLADATQRLLTNTTEVFKLRNDLKLRGENIGTLQKESYDHQQRADEAAKVAKDLRDLTATEGVRLKNEIRQVMEENKALKDDNKKVTDEIKELKEAAKTMAEQGARWEHEAHLLDEKVTVLELKDKEWQQTVHQKTQEIIRLNTELIDMTQTAMTREDEVTVTKNQLKAAAEEYTTLERDVTQLAEHIRKTLVVQASTLISMMRHRAEIDGAHFRLTRRMEDGSYKTVFYDAKKNPLWEVASQGSPKETRHLEIHPPAQEGGAGETEEAPGTSANLTETGGARRSLQRVLEIAQGSHEHLQCDEPNCGYCNPPGDDEPESEDEDPPEEEGSDEETADKHKKPLKVKPSKVKPRKAPRLEEAMNRDKVKKGDFLKKRREEEDKKKQQEEEDKKKKSGDESDSTSTGKKKKDEPASHDVEILDESVGEVEERSSTPTKSKKVIQSATSKAKVTEPESPKPRAKVIAVKQAVPIVMSASTIKERKAKQGREKAKRETSLESEASEASLPSTSTVSARSYTDSKTTRSRTTEPRSLAEALDKGQKAKSEPVKTKGKVKTAMKVDAMAMINYAEPDGESELDFTEDEEFDDPDDDSLTTVDDIINAYNGAEKNFTRIRTASVTSKFKAGLKTYLKKQRRSFTKQKFDVVLEFARNAGKLIQKHPSFSYEAKLFRPASSDKALTTPNEAVPMRVERAIAGMTSPLGSTSHRISQYINAVWNDGNGMIKEIDTATERVLPKLIKQNVLATTNANKGHPIRYTRVGLIPPERQIHCNMSDSQDMEKVTVSSKTKGPMDSESGSDDDTTTTAPSGPVTEKGEQPKGQETSGTTAEDQPKGHETSDKREKEKVMLPMDKAAAEAEADSARQVFHKSLFIPLKDVF